MPPASMKKSVKKPMSSWKSLAYKLGIFKDPNILQIKPETLEKSKKL